MIVIKIIDAEWGVFDICADLDKIDFLPHITASNRSDNFLFSIGFLMFSINLFVYSKEMRSFNKKLKSGELFEKAVQEMDNRHKEKKEKEQK